MSKNQEKKLFIISPIGDADSETRIFFNKVQKHLIRKICEPLKYKCVRADELDRPGIITSQIIECLVNYDLVIADLTDLNPNVFYELAIRHAVNKHVILLAKNGTRIPFDIRQDRVIFYSLDPDDLENAKNKLKRFVEAVESKTFKVESPLTSKINIITETTVSETEFMKEIYSILQDIRADQWGSQRSLLMRGRAPLEIHEVEYLRDGYLFRGIASPHTVLAFRVEKPEKSPFGITFQADSSGDWFVEVPKSVFEFNEFIEILDTASGNRRIFNKRNLYPTPS
jgi:hypothetical protein